MLIHWGHQECVKSLKQGVRRGLRILTLGEEVGERKALNRKLRAAVFCPDVAAIEVIHTRHQLHRSPAVTLDNDDYWNRDALSNDGMSRNSGRARVPVARHCRRQPSVIQDHTRGRKCYGLNAERSRKEERHVVDNLLPISGANRETVLCTFRHEDDQRLCGSSVRGQPVGT